MPDRSIDKQTGRTVIEGIPSGNISEIVPKRERDTDFLGGGSPEAVRNIQDEVRDTSEDVYYPNEPA